MKAGWRRETPELTFEPAALTRLVQPLYAGGRVEHAQPLSGGLRNQNMRLELDGGRPPVVLRVYLHDAEAAAREAALAELVARTVPVARVLHADQTNPVTGHPYALLECIDGPLLAAVVDDLGPEDALDVADSLGRVLAAIGSFRFPRAGLLDGDLRVREPFDLGPSGYLAYVRASLVDGRGGARLGSELTDAFVAFAERESSLLAPLSALPPTLVHSDFDVSNLIVRRVAGRWTTAAVLDWEYAYSGSGLADVGHVLRPPLGLVDGFAARLAAAYAEAGGFLPDEWRRVSRLLDSMAWVEFVSRPASDTMVVDAARRMLEAMSAADARQRR